MTRYPLERIYEEVAQLAYHFHWSRNEILELEHHERHHWLQEVAEINRQKNRESS